MNEIANFKGQHSFLSNFHPANIEFEGIVYPTSEHAFQAAKTLDQEERQRIAGLATPGKAKFAGKRVQLRDNWNNIRTQIMEQILRIKFSDPTLRQLLLDTGNAKLIEGNTWNDTFWGVCKEKGQNNLGLILQKLRAEFRG